LTFSDAVERAGWARLLPAHRAFGDDQPAGAPRCVDALPLGTGLLLAVVEDQRGRTYPVPVVVSADDVRRAVPGDAAAERVLELLAAGDHEQGDFRVTSWHHRPAAGEREITVDQTNESVVVGDAAVVKWTFLADEGPHPAPSMLAALDAAGFAGTPRPWGVVEWRGRLLCSIVDYLPGAVDGWTWAVEDIRTLDLARVESSGRAVGELVASFHRALAGTSRPATVEEAESWRQESVSDLDRALAVTTGIAHDVLAAHADAVRAAVGVLPPASTPVQRVHGDLHVGQALRAGPGTTYLLTDFDGNPVVPAAARVREQPLALDVAGMAQSFTHAGLVVRRHHPELAADAVTRAANAMRASFLAAYGADLDDPLLLSFSLRQVCREFTYAATHLPRWSYVPQSALPMLLDRGFPR
jgi:maltokinase